MPDEATSGAAPAIIANAGPGADPPDVSDFAEDLGRQESSTGILLAASDRR
jgi:hypothetical protein